MYCPQLFIVRPQWVLHSSTLSGTQQLPVSDMQTSPLPQQFVPSRQSKPVCSQVPTLQATSWQFTGGQSLLEQHEPGGKHLSGHSV